MLTKVATRILEVRRMDRSLIVGIDGVDLSGKTSLAHELAEILCSRGEEAIIVHEDDFLQPPEVRYRQGEVSVAGFYYDFFDFHGLLQNLLLSVRSAKPVTYQLRSNAPHHSHHRFLFYTIGLHDLVLVEGLFLLREELQGCLDLVIRLKIPSELVLERALARDVPALGSHEYVRRHYEIQVLPAQAMYETLVDPDSLADIIIENSDVQMPIILKE